MSPLKPILRALGCPGCGGVPATIRGSQPLRFRAQMGHGLIADALVREREGAGDVALA